MFEKDGMICILHGDGGIGCTFDDSPAGVKARARAEADGYEEILQYIADEFAARQRNGGATATKVNSNLSLIHI